MKLRAVLAAVAAVAVASCGGSGGEQSKSAQAILSDATHAARAATSVHLSGTAAAQGQQVPLDLRLTAAGAVGTAALGGVTVQLVRVGDSLYVHGAQQLLGGFLGAKAAAKIDGHWVGISTTLPQLAQFVGITDLGQLMSQTLTPTKSPTKLSSTVAGAGRVALRGFGTDGTGTLYVSTRGTPYPVKLVTSQGTLTFSGWNEPVSVAKPTDVIPLASLTG